MKREAKHAKPISIEKSLKEDYGDKYNSTFTKEFREVIKGVDKVRGIIAKKGIKFNYGNDDDEE